MKYNTIRNSSRLTTDLTLFSLATSSDLTYALLNLSGFSPIGPTVCMISKSKRQLPVQQSSPDLYEEVGNGGGCTSKLIKQHHGSSSTVKSHSMHVFNKYNL